MFVVGSESKLYLFVCDAQILVGNSLFIGAHLIEVYVRYLCINCMLKINGSLLELLVSWRTFLIPQKVFYSEKNGSLNYLLKGPLGKSFVASLWKPIFLYFYFSFVL